MNPSWNKSLSGFEGFGSGDFFRISSGVMFRWTRPWIITPCNTTSSSRAIWAEGILTFHMYFPMVGTDARLVAGVHTSSQNGNLPQIGVNVWNHHLANYFRTKTQLLRSCIHLQGNLLGPIVHNVSIARRLILGSFPSSQLQERMLITVV